MAGQDEQKSLANWKPEPIVQWLLDEGRFLPNEDELVSKLGDKLLAAGAPVWRLRLSMRTLHPLMTAVTSVWERDSKTTVQFESPHGLERRSGYVGSPLAQIAESGKPLRKKLNFTLTQDDHAVLHDLKARGGTDYFGTPMMFSDGASSILAFTTDIASGFHDQDIEHFTRIASALAPIVEVYNLRGVSLAVAEAYLGSRTGKRVLEGQITRGHIENMHAAILVSDIRDWTGLNNRLAPERALSLANGYFEIVAEAVEANGGEILKLIGDGVLAVFPTDDGQLDASAVCQSALGSAQQAFDRAINSEPNDELSFGIGLHFGEVLYGNIGSKTRVDFTILGRAVNLAARIEGLCGKLGEEILFSEQFSSLLGVPARLVAEEQMKGFETPKKIFTVS